MLLKPGQRLVSKEGDLWRWDGFTQAAEAPTPAARRLAEKNRLGDLAIEAEAARGAANAMKADAERAQTALSAAAAAENAARQVHKGALREIETARAEKAAAEMHKAATAARLSALEEAILRLDATRDEASEKHAQAKAALAQLDAPAELTARLDMARTAAAHDRAAVAEASAELQTHLRDARDARKTSSRHRGGTPILAYPRRSRGRTNQRVGSATRGSDARAAKTCRGAGKISGRPSNSDAPNRSGRGSGASRRPTIGPRPSRVLPRRIAPHATRSPR